MLSLQRFDHRKGMLCATPRRQCEKILALDRILRSMVRDREELMACISTKSDERIDFSITQFRTLRTVLQQRLLEHRDHYEDCAACRGPQQKLSNHDALPSEASLDLGCAKILEPEPHRSTLR
jgi:hypothetical protein